MHQTIEKKSKALWRKQTLKWVSSPLGPREESIFHSYILRTTQKLLNILESRAWRNINIAGRVKPSDPSLTFLLEVEKVSFAWRCPYLFKIYFYFTSVCMSMCMWVYHMCVRLHMEAKGRCAIIWNYKYKLLWTTLTQRLGTGLRSCGKAARTHNCAAFPLVPSVSDRQNSNLCILYWENILIFI